MPTVLSCNLIPDNRGGGDDDRSRRQYTTVYRVEFSTYNVGISYALYADGLPRPYDYYSGPNGEIDYGSRAIRRRAAQDAANPHFWTVTIEYDSVSSDPALATQSGGAGGSGGSPPNENPLMDPPRIQWGGIHGTEVLATSWDINAAGEVYGRPVTNSAKQPFSPLPTVDAHDISLTYTRNEPVYNALKVWAFWDTVNRTEFAGFTARKVKLHYTTAQTEYRNGIGYWVVTYYFGIKFPNWDKHLLDQGTKALDANGVAVTVIKGTSAAGTVLLDGNGHEQTAMVNGHLQSVTLDFRAYPEADLHLLGLPGL